MLRNFDYSNISFKKQKEDSGLLVSGEITNNSGRNYNSAVFRLTIFIKTTPIGSISIVIHGFRYGQTKTFEAQVGELEYNKVINRITKYEIYHESAY